MEGGRLSGTVELSPLSQGADNLMMLATHDGDQVLVAFPAAALAFETVGDVLQAELHQVSARVIAAAPEARRMWAALARWERLRLVAMALHVVDSAWELGLHSLCLGNRSGNQLAGEQLAQFELADIGIERLAAGCLMDDAVRDAANGCLSEAKLAMTRYATAKIADACSARAERLVSLFNRTDHPAALELLTAARRLRSFNAACEQEVLEAAAGLREGKPIPTSFPLSDELSLLKDTVRRYVDQVLTPLEKTLADPEHIPPDVRAQLEEKVKQMGFWAAAVPEHLGGGGIGVAGNVLLREQVCRSIVGDARDNRGFGGTPWPILWACDDEQRRRFLDPVVAGTRRSFFAMTEPGAGSDANSIATTAVRDGDEWVLNGSKAFATIADGADFGVVIASTDPAKRSRGGLSAFIVEVGTPGFAIERMSRTMGAAVVYELSLKNCRISAGNLLGQVGAGMELAGRNLTITRLTQASVSLGMAARGMELAIEYANQRETFGKRLIDRGAVQEMLVDSQAALNAARCMTYTVAAQLDAGTDAAHDAAIAKVYSAEMGSQVLDRAIQIFGGAGLTRDLPLERLYRDQRGFRITEGAGEVQRWVIARDWLRSCREEPQA
jgi:acyl-CoA dehydrogenase